MKKIPYSRQLIDKADIGEVVKILKSDWITQGPKVREFESALCNYTGAKYAIAVSSGTAALHIACLAAEIKSNHEVITSPITFAASANCILYSGAKPVFADIQENTINIDPLKIKNKISSKTRAIIAVHFAGQPVDLKKISEIARKNKLILIEDAAHALGAEYKKEKIGSCKYSDMTIFSFHPLKTITTGEGGAVLTNNKKLFEKLLLLRNHGITKKVEKFSATNARYFPGWYHEMQELGFNYRITDFQCALGISQLKKIEKIVNKRKEIAQVYTEAFKNLKGVILPKVSRDDNSSWHLYYLRLDHGIRDKVFNILEKKGIASQVHYIPVYLHPYYRRMGYRQGLCPIAEDYFKRTLSIPLFPGLTDKQIKYIINCLLKIFQKTN